MTKKSAFTLLELIIVIIIVGVLAALAIPNYLKTLNATALAEALAEISVLHKAVEGCYNNYGSYDQCEKITELPVDDPRTNPAANFRYGIGGFVNNYWIVAARSEIQAGTGGCEVDGSGSGDYIAIMYPSDSGSKCGYGSFSSFGTASTMCNLRQFQFKSTVDDEYK